MFSIESFANTPAVDSEKRKRQSPTGSRSSALAIIAPHPTPFARRVLTLPNSLSRAAPPSSGAAASTGVKVRKSSSRRVTPLFNAKNIKEPSVLIGRVAQEIGAAIECRTEAGSRVRIVFLAAKEPISLPGIEGLKYEINFYNLRPNHETYDGSDFPVYDKVLRDPGGRKFNLAHVEAKPSEPIQVPKHREIPPNLYRRGCCGLACDKVLLGMTTSLDQPTPS